MQPETQDLSAELKKIAVYEYHPARALLIHQCSERLSAQAALIEQQATTITGLLHNLSVIEGELKQIRKDDCGGQAWNRIALAIEFAERD